MRKLLVASQRSGVGKTTTSINLAAAAAMAGARVLLLEADPMTGISSALNLAQHPDRKPLKSSGAAIPGDLCCDVIPNLDVVSIYEEGGCSDDHMEQVFQLISSAPFCDNYDCLIVNAPPFLGARPEPLVRACDEYIVVMQAESIAHRMLPAFSELVQRSCKQAGVQIQWRGILLTLPESENVGGAVERELRGRFGTRVLPVVIPFDEEVPKSQLFGHVLVHASPETPAALEYKELASHLRLNSGATSGRTQRSVGDMLVMAGPAVQPVAPRRSEPITTRKSRTSIPIVRPSVPSAPPPPRQDSPDQSGRTTETKDKPLSERVAQALSRSSARNKPISDHATRPVEKTEPKPASNPGVFLRPSSPGLKSKPVVAAPKRIQLKQWLPYVAVAVVTGVGLRFLPLGDMLRSDLGAPIAVGVATAAGVGLALWLMAQKEKSQTPAEKPKK